MSEFETKPKLPSKEQLVAMLAECAREINELNARVNAQGLEIEKLKQLLQPTVTMDTAPITPPTIHTVE